MKAFTVKALLLSYLCLSTIPVIGQSETDLEIGIIPVTQMTEHILFVDGDAGEIASFAVLKEPVKTIVVSKEEGTFYAMTSHYIFKGDLETGDIIDEYQFMDLLEQGEDDLIDPNLHIIPYGISVEGIAVFQYNTPKEHESVESQLRQEIFIADLHTKTTRPYKKDEFHRNKKMFLGFGEGKTFSYDKLNREWSTQDITSGEAETFSFQSIYEQYPELNTYYFNAPIPIDEKHFHFLFMNPTTIDASGKSSGMEIKFDVEAGKIVEVKKFQNKVPENAYPVLRFDSKSEGKLYGKKLCDIPPVPTMPKMTPMKGKSKKKLAQWREENERLDNEFRKELAAWKEKSLDPMKQCEVAIYEDQALTRPVFTIPSSMFATIYSDTYAMVNRGYEIALYNIEAQELVWSIDTSF